MLKKIMLALCAFVAIILIVPMFLSSHFSMSRSVEIDAPVTLVFEKLTDLNVYDKWNPFPEGDPTNKTEITGLGQGSFLVWTGQKTGSGKMTISQVEPLQKISVKMEFYKPMQGEGVVNWLTNSKSESKTELIWTFDQELPYFNRYFGLIMESMMGKHFEKGLINYKNLIEKEIPKN